MSKLAGAKVYFHPFIENEGTPEEKITNFEPVTITVEAHGVVPVLRMGVGYKTLVLADDKGTFILEDVIAPNRVVKSIELIDENAVVMRTFETVPGDTNRYTSDFLRGTESLEIEVV